MAIADHGTFTAAAAALHVSQPALSQAVARLERELGWRLFERSAARTLLTAAGHAFLDPARRALAEVDNGRAAVEAVAGVLSGELRVIGVRTAVAEVARLVVEFHRRYEGIRIVLDEPADDRTVIEAVRSGHDDIGIIHSSAKPADLPGVAAGEQEIVAIFPKGLAPQTKTVTVEFLSTVPLIAPVSGTNTRAAHDGFFRRMAQQPRIAAECSDQNTLVELVRGGLGATLLSGSRAAVINTEGIAIRPLRPQVRGELTALRRPTASPAAEAFCQMLRPLLSSD